MPWYFIPFFIRQPIFEVPKLVLEPGPGCVGNDDIEPAQAISRRFDHSCIVGADTGILRQSAIESILFRFTS